MKLRDSATARATAIGLLAAVALVVKPVAQQGRASVPPRAGASQQIVTVDGHAAVAAEVLVKFRRALPSTERAQLDVQADADQSTPIGGAGVRRIHSRSYDTATLLAFLRTHPDVEYAEPNYIVSAD